MKKKRTKGSIIIEVLIMFAVCTLLTGGITFVSQIFRSTRNVAADMEIRSKEITGEVRRAVEEYPASKWLLSYWSGHADDLDIEYDAGFGNGTATQKKCEMLQSSHPGLQIRYATLSDIEKLSEEEKKLYAEITYSWLINRVDQIKESYHVNYLFCVAANDKYDSQFFIFSAANSTEERGTAGDQVYTLGYTKGVTDDQRSAMKDAEVNETHFTVADDYVDYYSYIGLVDGRPVFLGLSFSDKDVMDVMRSQIATNSMAAMGYLAVLAAICSFGLFFLVLKPLKKIQKSIRKYINNKSSAAVSRDLGTIKSRNEMGELSEDIVALADEIDDYVERIQKITAEKERIDAELSLAEQIQSSMLPQDFPPFPDREEFDIYACMDPAREVGGDFYDFFLIDDDHLCLVIADVSGKGIPAALFMMMTMIIMRNCTMMGRTPAEVLEATNNALIRNNKAEMFVTAWIGILEISTGRLTAANAGHEYPAIKKPGGKYEILRDRHGFVVGGMEGLTYKEYQLKLEPGSCIFVYTDGVPEATDPDDRLFGIERMTDALNIDPDAEPEKILSNVRDSVDEFVRDAEQFDDLTMLCMEYSKKE